MMEEKLVEHTSCCDSDAKTVSEECQSTQSWFYFQKYNEQGKIKLNTYEDDSKSMKDVDETID